MNNYDTLHKETTIASEMKSNKVQNPRRRGTTHVGWAICHMHCSTPLRVLHFSAFHIISMVLYCTVYLPPTIEGATAVKVGGTLFLVCDSTNSNREPLVQWFDKDGHMVSASEVLNIPNIMRSQAGTYICRTSPPNPDNSTSTTVTVVIQCECVLLYS